MCKPLHILCGKEKNYRRKSMEKKWIQINPNDNVAVALAPLAKGDEIALSTTSFQLKEDIAQGHKFALEPIKKEEK